ncbi:glycosyltransferase family 10 (fucosyltransferase) c-term domain-containing protein [Phthorimaea operculella]|nr:glycosyltransferase family 10 (fucosyltransferase) c-term domain-containing protein [Phthorimaea operculella]
MPRIIPWSHFRQQILRYNVTLKLFLFFSVFTFSYVIWSQYPSIQLLQYNIYKEEITEEAIYNVGINPKFAEIYRKKSRLPKDLKFILRWTSDDYAPFNSWGRGQRAFIKNNCSVINCYVTSDRNFFNGDLTKFHAIAFNGRQLYSYTKEQLPKNRSPHQKYIYFNTESVPNQPVCSNIFDDVFNWTATYRLDSDILYNYILIKDKNGNIVGPKVNMSWVENMDPIDEEYVERLQNKSKAAAWFVSHCTTKSKREQFASKLQKSLKIFNLSLDIFGDCGTLRCPRWQSHCDTLLEKDYFFYMSFENSFAEDYVTEKLLSALQHDVVPVVFGGADYSRYLPPGSYLDAREYSPMALAAHIHQIMLTPKLYRKFFRWKKYYTYEDSSSQNLCSVCEALNNRTKFEKTSVYHDFRKWWNGESIPPDCRSWYSNIL